MLIGNVHLVEGGSERIADIRALLRKEGIAKPGDPDVYVREYRQFGIEEARELRERAHLRAVGDKRVFILACASATTEAQNALLKTFEEVPGDALFFFIVPSPHMLLPTLRSRSQELALAHQEAEAPLMDARAFLAAPPAKRLDMLKPLLEKGEDDKRDTGAIIAFLASLEGILASKFSAEMREGVRALYRARAYLGDKGALVKPLLEQLAILVPRV